MRSERESRRGRNKQEKEGGGEGKREGGGKIGREGGGKEREGGGGEGKFTTPDIWFSSLKACLGGNIADRGSICSRPEAH